VIGDGPEKKKPQAVRDQKGEESGEAELDGELHGEKEAEPPDPGEGHGVSPEENIQETESRGGESGSSHGDIFTLGRDRPSFNPNGWILKPEN
jgi:hypothetical protein